MSYLTSLNLDGYRKMISLIKLKVLNNVKNQHYLISHVPKCPSSMDENVSHTLIGSFWIQNGPLDIVEEDQLFIMTPSVEINLRNLARTVLARKYPVLIQGPTSVGKTSIIEYLARRTGHRFVRINNHEHTDIQEYIGNYTSNDKGQMLFKEVCSLFKH
jgi:midasin